jgi:hypothetical protein
MMDAPVHAVDHETDALTHLVACQPLVEHATDDAFADRLAVQEVAREMAIPCQSVALQCPVHGLDDVAALTEFPQDRLGLWRHDPTSRFDLGRQPHTLQLARPIDQQCPVLAERVADVLVGTQVTELMLPLRGDQHPVEPGETIGIDLPLKLLRHLKLGLASQLQVDDLAGSLTDAVGDVVSRDVEGHHLTGTTFTRWLRAITDAEAAKIRAQNAKILAETEHEERRRQRRGRPRSS